MSRYGGAVWDSKTGVAWDSERLYKSRESQRKRRVFEQKNVFDIFCNWDILFSITQAYHEKGN